MTTTQTQIRRDTATNLGAATPAEGELFYDKTNKRAGVGDGSTPGGIPHASALDIQKQAFVYPTVGGTANAITLANTFPVTAYAAPLKQVFKATASNSGAVTVDVNGLGTKAVKKMDNGALAALVTGDIISGGIYEIGYDGTQFQLMSAGLSNSGVTAGTYTSPSSVTVDAKGRVTAIASGTGATMTALAVGSIIIASCSTAVAADATVSASNLTIRTLNGTATGLTTGVDSLSGTWKALQSVDGGTRLGGLFQRTA